MGFISIEHDHAHEIRAKPSCDNHGIIIEQIQGSIKVFKDGTVDRTTVTKSVSPFLPSNLNVTARDVYIDTVTNVWARVYVPKDNVKCSKLPLLVYFHGGGFCVGSTAWKCYHDFLGELSSKTKCIIVSVNYRLAPENRLPAAYEDGINAVSWVKQQSDNRTCREYWAKYCDFLSIYLCGDCAGANIAYNVALKLGTTQIKPLKIKGVIMIQPFFGGEQRFFSEKMKAKSCKTLLNSTISDAYWRLALPNGANRDHSWCNPLVNGVQLLEKMRVMVCMAEEDLLRDRNMEVCSKLINEGNMVEHRISEGVGHDFQIVDNSEVSQIRKQEMISDILLFVSE